MPFLGKHLHKMSKLKTNHSKINIPVDFSATLGMGLGPFELGKSRCFGRNWEILFFIIQYKMLKLTLMNSFAFYLYFFGTLKAKKHALKL